MGLVRLVEQNQTLVVQAVCVVAKGRRAGGRVFGMRALAVDELLGGWPHRCLGEMEKGLAIVAGGRSRLVATLASCMDNGGAGFYAKQVGLVGRVFRCGEGGQRSGRSGGSSNGVGEQVGA